MTLKFSDHQPYFIFIDTQQPKAPAAKFIKINDQSEHAAAKFKNAIQYLQLFDQLDHNPNGNPSGNYETLITNIQNVKVICMPSKTVKFRKDKHKKQTWITSGIIKSINQNNLLYKRLKLTDPYSAAFPPLRINLITFNCILKKCIRKAKQLHFTRIFNKCKNDIKKTWTTINSILNTTPSNKSIISVITDTVSTTSDKIEIASKFNSFFTNIGTQLANKLTIEQGVTHMTYLNEPINHTFNFHPVEESVINAIIDHLPNKTSQGNDQLSTKNLKIIKYELIKPITLIANQCINTGIFPNDLKIAKLIPVLQNGDKTSINNYRPISLLPVI